MISGFLLDSHPVGSTMVSWIRSGRSVARISDDWTPAIYVACDDREKLEGIPGNRRISPHVSSADIVERFERAGDTSKSGVLQLRLRDSNSSLGLAKIIESLGRLWQYRLYNVDVAPAQSYYYEHDIFPFGMFSWDNRWISKDDAESVSYDIPQLGTMELKVEPRKQGRLAKFSDRIESISAGGTTIQSRDEAEAILQLVSEVKRQDPDIIITENGDSFDFPYLAHRARECGVQDRLVLGREQVPLQVPRRRGTSYFSYGRMYFKPAASRLFGRIHIDASGCFIWNGPGNLHGLYEIARVCRMPMQTACRASIGKCMSSLQFYNAIRRGLLIPWKPAIAEAFKPRTELLLGDRGGLIFEPRAGVYDNVAELDFASLYGTIMERKNISAETISCGCCPDSENTVPELWYNICRRTGIVPQSLGILLRKRKAYTDLLLGPDDGRLPIYEARKSALKWILVTSFGYLGFNNAKFGRIDAHMAVCAFARKLLLQAVRIAEARGFEVLHGIVDSLWLRKEGVGLADCESLRREIVSETGFDMSLDIYKWIAFLKSREDPTVPVANRYFGALRSGKLKIRGIEARRHDTPEFFRRCQMEILDIMADGNGVSEVRDLMPRVLDVYEKYRKMLEDGAVGGVDLAFTTRASKNFEDYESNSVQKDAMMQLKEEGDSILAGQKIRYVITDYSRKTRRSAPLGMAANKYDVKRYVKLLAECCTSVTKPFGFEVVP